MSQIQRMGGENISLSDTISDLSAQLRDSSVEAKRVSKEAALQREGMVSTLLAKLEAAGQVSHQRVKVESV